MTPSARLTPDDLDSEPQLAVLHVLEETLWTARLAVINAHPELRDAHPPDPDDPSAALASTLLPLLDCVRQQLAAYRSSLDRQRDPTTPNVRSEGRPAQPLTRHVLPAYCRKARATP